MSARVSSRRSDWRAVRRGNARVQSGFSMIEVLIALVVLAVGLLGLGLLQTMNLRYTKSAQQRTLAVNLASELLDTMRSNRSQVVVYATEKTDFDTINVDPDGCATNAAMSAVANVQRWRCEVKEALGPTAWANVDVTSAPTVIVTVGWSEEGMNAFDGAGEIELETTL